MRLRRGLTSPVDTPPAQDQPPASRPRVLVGGVGYHWQRDASFGLVASDELARRPWPPHVEVADLGYGAIYVAQDLLHATPPYDRLVLVAGVERGREPGRVYPSRWTGRDIDAEELQERIREAGGGVVDVDHLLLIAQHFQALPPDVRIFEFEPVDIAGGTGLSPEAAAALPGVLEAVVEAALAHVDSCCASPCGGLTWR